VPTLDRKTLIFALLTVLGMLSVYGVGFHARTVTFERMGLFLTQNFWMESAQRFRYVELVASGEGIPEWDDRMWAPEGYDPRTDTIVQEQFYGRVYRALGLGPDMPVEAFVRVFTRVLYCFGIFALVALSGVLHRSRLAALLACLAYAAILPAVERSSGQVLYREHLAIPLFVFHLYFLAASLQRDAWRNPAAAGAFLLAAMLAWKVMTFYYLILAVFLAAAVVLEDRPRRAVRTLACCALPVIAVAVALPVHLNFDRFYLNPGAILSVVALTVGLIQLWRPLGRGARALAVGVGSGLLVLALPAPPSYDHAWQTILARVTHLGHKPADPAELTFHARHFWSGNYRSPSFARLVRDFGLPLLAALPGLVLETVRVVRRRQADAHALVLYLTLALGGCYLVFRKLQAFPAMLLAIFVGAGWIGLSGWKRHLLRAAVVVCAAGMVLQTYGVLPSPHRLFASRPVVDRGSVSRVYTGADLASLSGWLREHTGPDDVVLAEFALSPFLLNAADRPIALNCFFESPMVERYRDYAEALFAEPKTFHAFCARHQVSWVVHAAHQVLRTDDEMSYRYVADAVDWDPASAAARMQFAPAELEGFELAWESPFFRVFRVLGEGERPAAPAVSGQVLFSAALAAELFGDPAAAPWPTRGAPAELLEAQVGCLGDVALAEALLTGEPGDDAAQLAAEILTSAVERSPYEPRAYRRLSTLYRERDPDNQPWSVLADQAEVLEAGLRGAGPLPKLQMPR
jgi:hypothetical protein